MDLEIALRVFSLGCVGIAVPLNIAISVISMSELRYYYWNSAPSVTAYPFAAIPLALSFAICVGVLIYRRRHGKMPSTKVAPWDGLAFLFWVAILIAIWSSGIGLLGKVGFGLLAGYATAPMIVVMLIHLFFFKKNIRAFYSSFNIGAWKVHECPNCHSNFIVGAPKQPETTTQAGAEYSLLRGEEYLDADQDAVPYTDGRDSEEQIRPETEDKTEVKTDSKGKATIEV